MNCRLWGELACRHEEGNVIHVSTTELRRRFATALSALYASEVPAYGTLVDVCQEVNGRFIGKYGQSAERLGTLRRA